MTASAHTDSTKTATQTHSTDTSSPFAYLHDLRRHHLAGALKFGLALPLTMHQGGAPRDALAVARLVALRHEDCGPCVQILVDDVLKRGVSPELLRDVLHGRVEALTPELAAVYRLADATVRALPEAGDLGVEVERIFGRKALASLALAIASVRLFPTVKRALGYARSCSLVRLDISDSIGDQRSDQNEDGSS